MNSMFAQKSCWTRRCLVVAVFLTHFYLQELFLILPKYPWPPVLVGATGHKSHPLRDYTLLKAYDPGWMESRAVEVATGKTPACLE